jgi:hypothetical protein
VKAQDTLKKFKRTAIQSRGKAWCYSRVYSKPSAEGPHIIHREPIPNVSDAPRQRHPFGTRADPFAISTIPPMEQRKLQIAGAA